LTDVTERTAILNGDVTAEISKLKQVAGGNLLLICGPSLYAQLTLARLIDEYMLYVCPSVAGQGTHLSRELPDTLKLAFERTMTFASGMMLQYYRPVYQ
jgi:dihydrofolate reductase